MLYIIKSIAILFIVFFSTVSYAQRTASIKLLDVHDGDTVTIRYKSGKEYKIRLLGIDAPEIPQNYGVDARRHLAALLKSKELTFKLANNDQYGRRVGQIFAEGKDINLQMVKDGYAWHYKQYSKSKELAAAELYARSKRIGLWQDSKPIAPWEYRKKNGNSGSAPQNEPIIKSPVKGIAICLDYKSWEITYNKNRCPAGTYTIMK